MVESLVLFESVINSRWFLRTSIILFLNKIDVFKTKLPKVCLQTIMFSVSSCPVRFHSRDISRNTRGVPISTRQPSIFSGDSCKQIAPVSLFIPSTFRAFVLPFVAHASDQSNTSNGHDKHSFSIRSSKGNDSAECIKRLRYSVAVAFLCFLFSFFSGSIVSQVVFAIYW
jgi:hypothetical protein